MAAFAAPPPRLLDEDGRPARTRPGSGGPTRAGARCTRAGCSPSSRNRSSPSSSARTSCGPRAPRRSPAGQRLGGVDVPLVGQERLDRHAAAVAMRHHVRVRLDLVEEPAASIIGDDALARLEAIQPCRLSMVARARARLDAARKSSFSFRERRAPSTSGC
jgi:hypothetical protein